MAALSTGLMIRAFTPWSIRFLICVACLPASPLAEIGPTSCTLYFFAAAFSNATYELQKSVLYPASETPTLMPAARWAWARPAASAVVARTRTSPMATSPLLGRIFTFSLPSCGYSRLFLEPARAVRERELGQRLRADLDAVARRRRSEVAAADDPDRVDEVLVQVVDELAYAGFERRADRDEVEHGHVLGVLAEPDAAGVGAHRHAELRREQHDREHLVHAAEAAAVELARVDRAELEQLLEHDPVLHVLARRDADRGDRVADPLVAEHVVRAGRLLDPPRVDLREPSNRLDRLLDAPHLVRVEREPVVGADRVADEPGAANVALHVAADLELDV